jgi:hypothetical protein
MALYGRVLEKDAGHVTALNNLAWLLALRGRVGEGLKLVNRAIDAAGPGPGLLDTRAVAYLARGERDSALLAVRDLEATVAEASSPTTLFHLARAYELAGRRPDARRAWRAALAQGLGPNRIHPLELDAFRRLSETLHGPG